MARLTRPLLLEAEAAFKQLVHETATPEYERGELKVVVATHEGLPEASESMNPSVEEETVPMEVGDFA
jgi:hypothetical protein